LAVVWLLGAPPAPPAPPAHRAHGDWGVAYPPVDTSAPRAAVVFLHGMWASPEDSCGYFERSATAFGFLVCPRGNAPLGEGKMWTGTYATVAPSVHAALDAAARQGPGTLDRSGGGTLMGYSNGAYFAAEIARSEPGRWTGLVLLSMKALAERTDAAGLPTRFVSLGPGTHELPSDLDARMCDAIAWVREGDPAACRGP
jgi:predicted esterase